MLVMAKKGKRMGRPRKPLNRTPIYARVNSDVFEALSKFADEYNAANPFTERQTHVEIAIREYLERKGFWPPRPTP